MPLNNTKILGSIIPNNSVQLYLTKLRYNNNNNNNNNLKDYFGSNIGNYIQCKMVCH